MPTMKVGRTETVHAVPPGARGVRVCVTKESPWPEKTACLIVDVDGVSATFEGGAWDGRDGAETVEGFLGREWPREAKRDRNGHFVCVPVDPVKRDVVVDDGPEVVGRTYAVSDAAMRAAKNGVHAVVRQPVVPPTVTVRIDVLQEIEASLIVEFV